MPVPSFFFMITKNRSLVKMGEGPPGKVRIGSKKQKRCGGFTPTPLTSFLVKKLEQKTLKSTAKQVLPNPLNYQPGPNPGVAGLVRVVIVDGAAAGVPAV